MKETVSLDGIFIRTIYKASNYMVTRFEPLDKGVITVTGPSFDYEPYTNIQSVVILMNILSMVINLS